MNSSKYFEKFFIFIRNSFSNPDVKIDGIEKKALKAIALQNFYNKSPDDGIIVECGVAAGWSLGILA